MTRVRTLAIYRFVEHFNGTVLHEILRIAMGELVYDAIEALQANLD